MRIWEEQSLFLPPHDVETKKRKRKSQMFLVVKKMVLMLGIAMVCGQLAACAGGTLDGPSDICDECPPGIISGEQGTIDLLR